MPAYPSQKLLSLTFYLMSRFDFLLGRNFLEKKEVETNHVELCYHIAQKNTDKTLQGLQSHRERLSRDVSTADNS